ncbi:PREDICTED: copper-transporting ATPase 1-like [Nanorana parkeri]|uniref:copper-transporting ATPase 1-like n=1 Tax=Nanorana parkeri TaxID=125878 RepID=UPI00085453F8|nr:PREDICTED: copper-transporting ATPase 1-like [Nanorana parkeri]
MGGGLYRKPSREKLELQAEGHLIPRSLSDISVHVGISENRRSSPKLNLFDRFVNYSRASLNSLLTDKPTQQNILLDEPDKHTLLMEEMRGEEDTFL